MESLVGLLFLIYLTSSTYIVLSPRTSTHDTTLSILNFDTETVQLEISIYAASNPNCVVFSELTLQTLESNNCIVSTPIYQKTISAAEGWNTESISFDENEVPTDAAFIVVQQDGTGFEYLQRLWFGTIGQRESLLMQTDKALYKPGETVQFRILAVDSELSILHTMVNVQLISPTQMTIAEWNLHTNAHQNGIVKGEFPIDVNLGGDFLGEWTLRASSADINEIERTFELEEYTLQRFETVIDAPTWFSSQASAFAVNVTGTYTYGEGLNGNVMLEYRQAANWECWGNSYYFPGVPYQETCGFYPSTNSLCTCDWEKNSIPYWYSDQDLPTTYSQSNDLILGSREFIIETNDFHYDDWNYGKAMCFRATVTEEGTGDSEQGTGQSYVEFDEYKIIFEESKCIPGFDFVTHIQIADSSGFPLSPNAGDPEITVYKIKESSNWDYMYESYGTTSAPDGASGGSGGSSSDTSSPGNYYPAYDEVEIDFDTYIDTHKLDDTGGSIEIIVHKEGFDWDTYTLEIRVEYGYNQISTMTVDCLYAKNAYSDDKDNIAESRIRVTSDHDTVSTGETITFTVESSGTTLENVYYMVTSGQVYGPEPAFYNQVGSIDVASTVATVDIEATIDYIPEIRFTIFKASDGANTLLADYTSVTVTPRFGNIQASFTQNNTVIDTVMPGEQIGLTLETTAESTVLVGIVDSSILLMSTPNDITKSYAVTSVLPEVSDIGCYQVAHDTNLVVDDSGLVLLATDFANYKTLTYDYRGPVVYYDDMAEAGAVPENAAIPMSPTSSTAGPDSSASSSAVQTRSFFPESWLWTEYDMHTSVEQVITMHTPDTITSWTLTAVSVNMNEALGIADNIEIITFKPFFVSLNLPYNVIQNEEFSLNITVFNYEETDLTADIKCQLSTDITIKEHTGFTLQNIQLIEDLESSSSYNVTKQELASTWTIPARQSRTESIIVAAKMIGQFPIVQTAVPTSPGLLGDQVVKTLTVTAEGSPVQSTYNVELEGIDSIDLATWDELHLTWPANAVPGSEEVVVSLTGDILGGTMANLDYLIQQPCGCGEQNMLYTAPQVYVFNYLSSMDQLSADQKKSLIQNLQTGYSRELQYMHTTGSDYGAYSAFGDSDEEPSMWLTAFVTHIFTDMYKLQQSLDENIVATQTLQDAIDWIMSHQTDDGYFDMVGTVIHEDMKGGVDDGNSLTCFVMNALKEAESIPNISISSTLLYKSEELVQHIVNGYLSMDLTADDIYPFSICANALRKINADQDLVKNKLNLVAKTSIDMRWWDNKDGENNELDPAENAWDHAFSDAALAVEVTSYNLLTFYDPSTPINVRDIANWLLKQRNENGGFSSTQDTCMGLKALSTFATGLSSDSVDLDVLIKLDNNAPLTMTVTEATKQLYQLQYMDVQAGYPPEIVYWQVQSATTGHAYLAITQRYNIIPELTPDDDDKDLRLKVFYDAEHEDYNCGKIVARTSYHGSNGSGMVILNAKPVSGCGWVQAGIEENQNDNPLIKLIEYGSDGSVTVYLDYVNDVEMDIGLPLTITTPIHNTRSQPVYVQTYYDPSVKTVQMYNHVDDVALNDDDGDKIILGLDLWQLISIGIGGCFILLISILLVIRVCQATPQHSSIDPEPLALE